MKAKFPRRANLQSAALLCIIRRSIPEAVTYFLTQYWVLRDWVQLEENGGGVLDMDDKLLLLVYHRV
jgi:hypothetical protein